MLVCPVVSSQLSALVCSLPPIPCHCFPLSPPPGAPSAPLQLLLEMMAPTLPSALQWPGRTCILFLSSCHSIAQASTAAITSFQQELPTARAGEGTGNSVGPEENGGTNRQGTMEWRCEKGLGHTTALGNCSLPAQARGILWRKVALAKEHEKILGGRKRRKR